MNQHNLTVLNGRPFYKIEEKIRKLGRKALCIWKTERKKEKKKQAKNKLFNMTSTAC